MPAPDKGAAYASALVRRRHGQRGEGQSRRLPDLQPGEHDVADDAAVFLGHQAEFGNIFPRTAQAVHEKMLVAACMLGVFKGRAHQVVNNGEILGAFRADSDSHG